MKEGQKDGGLDGVCEGVDEGVTRKGGSVKMKLYETKRQEREIECRNEG